MDGKAIVNGEQSKSRRKIGYGKGEIMIISFNSALLGTYKFKTELLDGDKRAAPKVTRNIILSGLFSIAPYSFSTIPLWNTALERLLPITMGSMTAKTMRTD